MRLRDKVAIVTGGTKGIGRSISEYLCREGVKVMACSREGRAFASDASQIFTCRCDVRSYESVRDMVEETYARYGRIDFLVNNAGVCHLGRVDRLSPEAWNEVIATNLTGAFYCCRETIPRMIAHGGGHIVNISSRSGINAFAGGAAYNASKFALNGFSEALLLDMRDEDIRVSYIMPGRVATTFADEEPADWHIAPEDVAQTVVDLLTMDSRSVVSRVEIRPSRPASYLDYSQKMR